MEGELPRAIQGLLTIPRTLWIEFVSVWLPLQLGLILIAALAGLAVARLARRDPLLDPAKRGWTGATRQASEAVIGNLGPIVFILVASVFHAGMARLLPPSRSYLIGVAISLALAWVIIAILAALIRNRFLHRVVAVSAWTIAALSILGLLDPTTRYLDALAVEFGGLRISVLLVLKAGVLLMLALWAALASSDFLDRRLRGTADLTPSLQVLIGKLIRLALVSLAILIVLSSVGINLSALALFSGAVGVGVGLGLQKVVSNLVCGIILLADKSIKPGDVLAVGDSFGWVDSMGARYTSLVTRDGRDVLIPNEDLVTQRVVNWSHSNQLVRIDVPFGVGYECDPHRVREVAVAAARTVQRVLTTPEPVCHLTKFDDSSVDFLLRVWINDPIAGVTNLRGEVMLALWDAAKQEGFSFPFPIRDVRLSWSADSPPPGSAAIGAAHGAIDAAHDDPAFAATTAVPRRPG